MVTTNSGNSPWDEPLPENNNAKKTTPTVVGDLDVKKNVQTEQAPEEKTTELKIPTDTEEKVGAKVNVATVAPIANASSEAPKPQTVAPSTVQPVAVTPEKSEKKSSSFWQTVYGQNGHPEGATAAVGASIGQQVNQAAPAAAMQNQTAAPVAPAAAPTGQQIPIKPTAVAQPGAAKSPVNKTSIFGNKKLNIIIASALGIIILLSGGVFLTEKGLISIGFEKVYGALRLESLWGGLPANAENAFALSALEMKTQKSFKISGTATITANKGVKSTIISPLVSISVLPVVSLKDEQMGPKLKAVLAAVDTSTDSLFTEDDTTSDTSATDTSTTDASTTIDSTLPSATDTTGAGQATGGFSTGSASTTTTTGSTVKEIKTEINASISDQVSGSKIAIKKTDGSDSEIQLVYARNKMYLKTTTDIVYDSQAKSSWVSFDFNKFGQDTPSGSFWGGNFSGSDFSIIGSRGTSEKVDGVRCFKYSGKATIGSSLENFGLKDNSVSSLDFDYWIGVSDHLVRKVEMKIIPSSESAVSRIDLVLNLSDFDQDSNDFIVPATSNPYVGITGSSATGSTTVAGADLTTAKGRDTQRKADLANISKALETYHSAQGKYPLVTGVEKITSASSILKTALSPTYLSIVPIDPSDPTYYYGYESDGTSYKLSAALEDKADASGRVVGSAFLYFLSSQ